MFLVTALEMSGQNAGEYNASLASDTVPVSLSPGESRTVSVGLEPASFGQKFATLSVQTNDTRQPVAKVGLSNTETTFEVNYGSVNVTYFNPSSGPEPTVNVDDGLQGRNATLRAVNSDVNAENKDNYTLSYTFDSPGEVPTGEALNESTGTPLRYVEATTTNVTDPEFNESTIQMTASKAALAAQDTTPENVTIYHDGNDNGTYEALETELLFETQQGYVYEATTQSYSTLVIAGDAPESGDSDNNDDNNDDSNDDSNDDNDQDADEDDDDTSSTGSSGGGVSSPPEEDPETDSTEEPEEDGDADEESETDTTEESEEDDDDTAGTDSAEGSEEESDTTETDSTEEPTDEPAELPGFGVGIALIALLAAALLVKRWNTGS